MSSASDVSISRNGRFVAIGHAGGVDLVDVVGTAPRRSIETPAAAAFAIVGHSLWIVAVGTLRRVRLDGRGDESSPFAVDVEGLRPGCGPAATTAIAFGDRSSLVEASG